MNNDLAKLASTTQNTQSQCVGLQNGSYVPGRQLQATQDVSGYTAYPFADIINYDDMTPTFGSCIPSASGLNATLVGFVDTCAQSYTDCCYNAAVAGDQVIATSFVRHLYDMTLRGAWW